MGVIKRTIRRKIRTPVKRQIRQQARRAAVTCGTCGKRYANPLTHTCTVKTDFKKRAAADKRRQAAEARRQRKRETAARRREAAKARRKAAADRRRAAAAARRKTPAKRTGPAKPAHDYRTCRDPECRRHACVAYREGMADCPLEHL